MKAIEKARRAVATDDFARRCCSELNDQRPTRPMTQHKEWQGDVLTIRTIRKARQGKIPALGRVIDALILKDDGPEVQL